MGGLGVKTYKRLIHDDQLRLMNPGGDDGQLLLHAVGIGGNGLDQIGGQLKALGQRLNTFLTHIGGNAEDVAHEVEILHAGHEIVQIGIIGDVGDAFLAGNGIGLDGNAVNGDFAAVELQNAHNAFQRGGLAGAVVADEAVKLAGLNVQGQIVHGLFLAVGLG